MVTLVRAARVVLLLVLALFVISLVVGIARPETGAVEKVVLVALVAGSVFVAAKLTHWAARLENRLHPDLREDLG